MHRTMYLTAHTVYQTVEVSVSECKKAKELLLLGLWHCWY